MKNGKWLLVAAALLLCFAPCAVAQDTLDLTSAGNNIMGNVYVGPYTATIDNSPGNQIICTDFADESKINAPWPATANTFSSIGNTLWGQVWGVSTATIMYEEAAWLTVQMLSGKYGATDIGYMSYAIWYIFDATKINGGVTAYLNTLGATGQTIMAGLLQWVTKAQNGYSSLTASQLASFKIYTPQGCTVPGTCQSQEFFKMEVPEGGSAALYLLLAGVSCLGAIFFRSRGHRAKPGMA